MTVKEIVKNYLEEHGYDGLYAPYLKCSCKIDDLMPCGVCFDDCRAGYLILCEDEDYDFCIGEKETSSGSVGEGA